MAFPRARLRRFNESCDVTPGVGAYNLVKEKQNKDKAGSLARINETLKNCRDKALVAAEKGTLPKHIEEIHTQLAHAQERVLDLEVLKIGWDKQRELTEKEKIELKQKLATLETLQVNFNKTKIEKDALDEEIKSHLCQIQEIEQRAHKLQLKITDGEKRKTELEEEKLKLTLALKMWRETYAEMECNIKIKEDEILSLKKNNLDLQSELETSKNEYELLKVEICSLKQKLFEMEGIEDKLNKIDNLKNELEEQVKTHLHNIQEIEQRTHQLQSEVTEGERRMGELEKEKLQLTIELDTMKETCEEESTRLGSQNVELLSELEQAHGDVEELTQHVLFSQNKLQVSSQEQDKLIQAHEKETEEFETEKQFLTSQIQSLIIRCEECEDKLKKTKDSNAMQIASVRDESIQKMCELEEKNRNLENMVVEVEKDKAEVLAEERHLKERLTILENAQMQLDAESSTLAHDLTGRLLSCEEQVKALESENDDLMQKMEYALEKAETIETESKVALEKLKASYSEDTLAHEKQVEEFEIEKQTLTSQIQYLVIRCEECEDILKNTKDTNAAEIESVRDKSNQRMWELEEKNRNLENTVAQVEKDKAEVLEEECHLKERLTILENAQMQRDTESSTLVNDLTGRLNCCEEDVKALKSENDDLMQKLEYALEKAKTMEAENKASLEKVRASCSEDLAKEKIDSINLQQKQEDAWLAKVSALEDEKKRLESEINVAAGEIQQFDGKMKQLRTNYTEVRAENENLSQHLSQMEKDLKSLQKESVNFSLDREDYEKRLTEADHEIEGLTTMVAEMSEKITILDCERSEIMSEMDTDWKEKYDDLEKKMEPFKDILDGFDLERQLLHDRDKFTSEQLEKLTREAIKNMGHQNHKQRIKYLDKMKQENMTLSQTVQELRAQIRRQDASIKKLKEKTMVDKTETTKKPWQRTPLKEGNRL